MKLAQYLETEGLTDRDFAGKIGVGRQTVYRYKTGERFPEQPILQKIFTETKGAVTPNDFAKLDEAAQ